MRPLDMNRRKLLSLPLLALALITAQQAQGAIQFADFEPTTYTLGNVVGQEGWIASNSNNGGAADVDNTRASSGSQSLRIDTTSLGGPSWWYQSFSVDAANLAVEFEFDMYLESNPSNDYSIFGVDVYGSTSSFSAFRLWTEYDFFDEETYINTSEGITLVPVTRDAWHNYRVLLDFEREEYDVYFDDLLIETGFVDVGLVGTVLTDVDIWSTAPSGFGDRAWYDNLRVSVVPEPSAMCFLLSLVGMSRLRRSRQS